MKRRILLVDDDMAVLLESGVYQMVITDLRMETEDAGQEVIRAARRQSYDPATALLTAHPPAGEGWGRQHSQSLLIKPLGTRELIRQVEALLVRHEDEKQLRRRNGVSSAAIPGDTDRKVG